MDAIPLRALRRRKGLTQQQLADAVKTDQTTISDLELGYTRAPSWPLVKRLCDVFKVKPEVLFPVTDEDEAA